MSLYKVVSDHRTRSDVAADAVAEAESAVRDRNGLGGFSAQLGLETINLLRPGFLERHIHAMLPAMALVIEPHWNDGVASGDGPAHLEQNADAVTGDLLDVADAYVAGANDAKAIAVYNQLRPRAPRRVAEQMPRIARFIERHTPPA